MYADDLARLNATFGRLQKMLNIMNEFCLKFCLNVNLSKSNVIVFRKDGILRNFVFNGKKLEVVPYYI